MAKGRKCSTFLQMINNQRNGTIYSKAQTQLLLLLGSISTSKCPGNKVDHLLATQAKFETLSYLNSSDGSEERDRWRINFAIGELLD